MYCFSEQESERRHGTNVLGYQELRVWVARRGMPFREVLLIFLVFLFFFIVITVLVPAHVWVWGPSRVMS